MLREFPYRPLVAALLALVVLLLAALFWRLNTPPPPDPRLIDVSVRSTLFALPTQTPWIIEVTAAPTPTPPARPSPTPPAATATATPTMAPSATPAPAAPAAVEDAPVALAAAAPAAADAPAPVQGPAAPPQAECPAASSRGYDAIPIASAPIDHPDSIHGDLNLWQRGWSPTDAPLMLVDINGPADGDPPLLAGLFSDGRLPPFVSAAQVYDWNWGCSAHGCRGDLLTAHAVTLLGLATNWGEALAIPARGAEIYGGGYKALVLYAETQRITLGYTREDSVANGYSVHLEGLCVDPNLLALYRQSNAVGRGSLPGLRSGETLGTATDGLLVAVRDRGVFMDPRSRKDWWRGF